MYTVVLSLALALAPVGRAAEPIIGLLTLPEVFGEAPCERFTPENVPLYSAPDSGTAVGAIRVDRNWTFGEHGGCVGGLIVSVHRNGADAVTALPILEYEYEAPAAIVLRQQGQWFELRLSEGTGWVHASPRARYIPLRDLLLEGLTYLTDEWDGRLASVPGGPDRVPVPADPLRNMVGYVEGTVRRVRVVLQPGQSVDSVRTRYRSSAMCSRAGPNGTRILTVETGTAHPLFTTPDRQSPPVAEVESNRCDLVLQTAGQCRVPVFEHRAGWYQVARANPEWRKAERLWLAAADWRFHPVSDPAERERLARQSYGRETLSARVLAYREIAGVPWVEVEVLSHSLCEGMEEPSVRARGWIPAHAPSTEPNIWFSSRGC